MNSEKKMNHQNCTLMFQHKTLYFRLKWEFFFMKINAKSGRSEDAKKRKKGMALKCHYDQILEIHFFTFSYTMGLSQLSLQISIHY